MQQLPLKFKQALQGQMYSFEKMKNLFERAGAPYDPTHIGLTRAQLKAMFPVVQLMRFRYNVLDLAKRAGFCIRRILGDLIPIYKNIHKQRD